MRHLNTRQVEAFRALMLTSSTVRAAELMHVTQPAVSRLVREFQEALGITLFERTGNRLKPTNDALALYAEVERSYVGLEKIAQAARELRNRDAGTLRIAAMPALCNGALPRFIGEFQQARPRLDLELHGLPSQSVVDWAVSEQCDLGFVAAPVEAPAIRVEKLPAVPYVAVVPEGHPLAKKSVLHPRDFEGERFIALGASTRSRFRIDDVFGRHGVSRSSRLKTPLSEIACALVAAGAGVSVVDPFTAREFETRGVAVRRFEPAIEFQVAAVYPPRRALSEIAAAFLAGFTRYVERVAIERARSTRKGGPRR